jgi:uncharacterized OB-fold protein
VTAPYLPGELASLDVDDPVTGPFWQAARDHQLVFQRCTDCGAFRHPPADACRQCRSFAREWAPVDGPGTVFTYTVVHRPYSKAVADYVPYIVAIVVFAGAPGVKWITNLVGAPSGGVEVGMPVEVVFEPVGEGGVVPRVRPLPRDP